MRQRDCKYNRQGAVQLFVDVHSIFSWAQHKAENIMEDWSSHVQVVKDETPENITKEQMLKSHASLHHELNTAMRAMQLEMNSFGMCFTSMIILPVMNDFI